MTADPKAGSAPSAVDVAELCFAARALAQSHPMTETARLHRQACFEQQRAQQPLPEFADWATTALDVGYCLRRVEEDLTSTAVPSVAPAAEFGPGLAAEAARVADRLRRGDPGQVTLLAPDTTVAALDRLIATELDKRAENVRDQLDDSDWHDLEAYLAWWVVHGYAVRATEFVTPDHPVSRPAGHPAGHSAP